MGELLQHHSNLTGVLPISVKIDFDNCQWFGRGGYKEQIKQLAKLADEIINDEDFSSLDAEENRIYDLAAEITDELFEPLEDLEKLYRAAPNLSGILE